MAVDSVSLVHIALQALGRRVAVLVTALCAFALFSWAMYLGDYLRLAIAATFALLVFLPVLLKGDRRNASDHS